MEKRPFFILEMAAFLLVMPWASKSALGGPNVPGYIVEAYASVPVPQTLSFDDQTGVLYVGNGASQPASIYRISPDQHIVSPYGGPILDPDAVICDPYGHTWSGEFFGPGTVLVGGGPDLPGHISAIRQDESTVIIFESYDFENPTDMAFDSTGRLLFVDWDARGVFQTSGEDPNILFPTPTRPYNIAVHPDDDRIFVSTEEGTIRIYEPNGTLLDDNFATGLPTYLNGIPLAFGPGGVWGTDLYVIGHNLRRYDAGGNYTIIGTGFGTNHVDMTFGPDGSLYVSGNISDTEEGILRITPEPPKTYHIDGSTGDNTNDGLTRATAFRTIQRGINVAEDFDTVLVWPGVYNEEVSFWGDAITVKSASDAAIVETDYGYSFSFFSAEGHDTVLSNFVIRNSQYGIYLINGASPTLRNLTIVNNDFGISAFNGADPDISSCIFWNNYYGDLFREPVPLQARYSCIEEGGEGEGNISVEPGFVDANSGDYHLLSERGRYWPAHDVWVLDDVTSTCIDGGDPKINPSNERMPNGGRINMGAYGNTAYASMSEWPLKHDSNFDGVVDMRDLAELALEWLETIPVIPEPYVPNLPPAPAPVIITIGAVSSSSIRMTASEAFDESGVEYYFEALSAGGHDSGWIGARTYTDAGLIPDTTYCYRVKARDKSANHNETIWSPQVCAVTVVLPDTLAPLPDPMQWDPVVDANGYDGRPLEVFLAPFGPTDYGATMRAIDADDQAPVGAAPSEVEYYFQCQDDSGFDSGWRTVALYPNELERRTYTVKIGPTGLAYRFRVKARDASNNLNETGWSDWFPAVYRDPP